MVDELAGKPRGTAQITPDFELDGRLYDVKTLAASRAPSSHYCRSAILSPDTTPVDRRSMRVNSDYLRHAHKTDVKYAGTAKGDRTGPLESRVKQNGVIVGVVVGAFGEASAEVHDLLARCAEEIGEARFRELEVETPQEAVAIVKAELYREWGVAFSRWRAKSLFALLDAVGPGGAARRARKEKSKYNARLENAAAASRSCRARHYNHTANYMFDKC